MTLANVFVGKKVLVVTAHPDDEALAAAGLIRQVADSGGEVRILCATSGERGRAYLLEDVSEQELKKIREAELGVAAQLLGVSLVSFFGLPDGGVAGEKGSLEEAVMGMAKVFQPDLFLSFGPDGYTGHSDHVAVHSAVKNVATQLAEPFYVFCLPPAPFRVECQSVLLAKRKYGDYDSDLFCPEPQYYIEVDPQQKLKVLECHQSQFSGLDPYGLFSPPLAKHILSYEYFTELT